MGNIFMKIIKFISFAAKPIAKLTEAIAKKEYAVVSPDGTTLTFYFDKHKSSRQGTAYRLNVGKANPKWVDFVDFGEYSFPRNSNYTTVVFDESFKDARPVSCAYWFGGFKNLTKIEGIDNLNTSRVRNMSCMFWGCDILQSVDMSGFNTSKVTDMNRMFWGCKSMESIDLSSFNTANVTDMSYMFRGCEVLENLDLSGFNTANVTDMSCMFWECEVLENLDLSNFNTSKVISMDGMFSGCKCLSKLDVSCFNTSKVVIMSEMFEDCKRLESVGVDGFNTSQVMDMGKMFSGCENLQKLDISNFNTSLVIEISEMFSGCKSLKTIYVGEGWDTYLVGNPEYVFYDCTSLVGGKGTKYDSEFVDVARAKIDGGKDEPGYFTAKK